MALFSHCTRVRQTGAAEHSEADPYPGKGKWWLCPSAVQLGQPQPPAMHHPYHGPQLLKFALNSKFLATSMPDTGSFDYKEMTLLCGEIGLEDDRNKRKRRKVAPEKT
jgi:hypothetical protein